MSNAEQTDTESQVTNKKQEGVRCCLLNIDYLKTKNGIFRIAIIVLELIGLIAALASTKPRYNYTISEDSFIFFSSFDFFLSILILLFYFWNCFSVCLRKIYCCKCATLDTIIAASDIIMAICMAIMGIVAAVDENTELGYDSYRPGSMAVAAFCAFLCTLLHAAIAVFMLKYDKSSRYK